MWEAVEIQPNVFDYDYLDKVEKIINVLGENGIYTMIDAHEDVFARNFCGEGVPYFYVNEMGYDKKCDASIMTRFLGVFGVCKTLSYYNFNYDEKGLPLVEDCKKHTFGEYNSLAEVSSANRNFYDNKNGIQDKFIEFWKVIAKRFKGNKYVLGYDFWNEPSPGSALEDPKSFIPGRPDIQKILPLYRKINTAPREIDPDFILYFENTPFPDTLPILGGLVL
jgi:endoglycosylceramidase